MSNLQEYTIGWICAITTEFIAAQAFLDEKHESPDVLAYNDNNNYALGRIGKHNVVMATLPKASYGTTSAAVVARDMVHSFPNIRVGLMVGVGGGAPSQNHDIRLGDVVVGCPSDGEGGIIQYDYGKTIQNQNFTQTGHLNQPPQSLLTAVGGLETAYALDGHRITEQIEKALNDRPRLRRTHSLPAPSSDRLYKSDIIHPPSSSADCSQSCSTSHLVIRHERADDEDNPAIHYGIIASSNQLMKDAFRRDALSSERGVLCFEMEAAGLMNHFPCLVIRGICDYSDTHKNKAWQGYAAMTAAAYAKDIIAQLIPSRVETEAQVAKVLKSVEENQRQQIQTLAESKADIKDIKAGQKIETIWKWLIPPDTSVNINNAKRLRHQGTGRWILESQTFQEWHAGSRHHLWLNGLPGCGKTILLTTILDSLLSEADQVVLQFYFDFSNKEKQTVSQMLRGLIFQLFIIAKDSTQLDALRELDRLYAQCLGRLQPTCSELSVCLLAMLKHFRKAFVLVDALDECSERKDILAWIRDLGSSSCLSHVKLLITGRPEVEFEQDIPQVLGLDNCMSFPLESVNSDIRSYVDAQLGAMTRFRRWASAPEVLQMISEKVGNKADGMFRWAACQLDTLEGCLDLEAIEKTLDSLPQDLNDTYDRILDKIPPDRREKSILLLQFLLHSEEPLTLEQAVDLLAIQKHEFESKYRMPDPLEIPLFCPSLVSIVKVAPTWDRYGTKTQQMVQLAHFSVKEYLRGCRWVAFNLLNASIDMTRALLAYLTAFSNTKPRPHRTEFPLIEQAYVWPIYARQAENADDITQAAADFLQNQNYFQTWKMVRVVIISSRVFGSDSMHDHDIYGKTALSWACGKGLREIAKTLISRGVGLGTPLDSTIAFSACVESGLYDVAQLLINAVSEECGPLQVAARKCDAQMVEFFLGWRADTKMQVDLSNTSLIQTSNHLNIARTLLEHGANPNVPGRTWDEVMLPTTVLPLNEASAGGQVELARLLLHYGADVNAHATEGSALLRAATEGHEEVARLLLEAGALVNDLSHGNRRPLAEAARRGHTNVVQLLLENHALADAQTQSGSALLAAAQQGHTSVVRLLLEYGANYEAVQWMGSIFEDPSSKFSINNPSSETAHNNQQLHSEFECPFSNLLINNRLLEEMMRLSVQYKPRHGDDPLAVASIFGHAEVVRLFLEQQKPSRRPAEYWSRVLATTIIEDHYHITRMLVEAGADFNAPVEEYGCLINLAIALRRLDVVKLLRRHITNSSKPCAEKTEVRTEETLSVHLARYQALKEIAHLISQVPRSASDTDKIRPAGENWLEEELAAQRTTLLLSDDFVWL